MTTEWRFIKAFAAHFARCALHEGETVAVLSESQQTYTDTGALQVADAQRVLSELQKTYVMADQHVVHQGGKVAQQAASDISFF